MVALSPRRRVGIEKMSAYPCSASLDMRELASARGEDPNHPSELLMMDERAVNPCWEDPVTMAVNAALPMLDDEDKEAIDLVVVGTESSPDQSKPISTFIQHHLGIQPRCRNFETKHACYGGTSALMVAAHWVASGVAPGRKALVIGSDQSRMNLGVRWEYVMGAGACALLVSDNPAIAELELETNGYWTREVGDTFRPTSRAEAGNTDESLYCYLEGLEGAYEHFKAKNDFDYDRHFAQHVYHVPFSAMARRAHRTILKRDYGTRRGRAEESFERKVLPSLTYTRRFGGIYTAATFIGLMGTLAEARELAPGDRVSVFSYGSGSCAEMYSVKVGPEARERVRAMGLAEALDARKRLSVAQYEATEKQRDSYVDRASYEPPIDGLDDLYRSHYADKGRLVLRGVTDHFRRYDWS